jgi:Winged helix DNA-binding domain
MPRAASASPAATLRALNRATLARQVLLGREKAKPLAVIERLAGLQAQWPMPPFVGLWTRVDGFRRDDLTKLLHARDAVRATTMRGTIHVVSARDYLATRGPVVPVLERGMRSILQTRGAKLDVDRVTKEATAMLAKGPATFERIRDHLASLHPKADERAMGYAVRMRVPLVMVPTGAPWAFPADAEFALAEAWIGKKVNASDDPRPLLLRYLSAFGPATVTDMQTWSGLQGLAKVVDTMRDQLVARPGPRGRELFDLPGAPNPGDDVPAPPRFLPAFDNLLLAHADRSRVLADEHKKLAFASGLRVEPTFLVDGMVAGTWKVARKKAAASLTVTPFAALAKADRRALTAEADALVRFLEPDASSFAVAFAAP